MAEETFNPEAFESKETIRSNEEIRTQGDAVTENINEIGSASTQAEVDNIKAEKQKLNNMEANAAESILRQGGVTDVTPNDLNNLNDRMEQATRSGTLGSNASTIRGIETSTDPSISRARNAFDKALNAAGKILNDRFTKSLESKHPELKDEFNKISSDTQNIANKMRDELNKPNPDPKVLNDLESELNAKQKEFEKLFDKADKISDEVKSKKDGIDYSKILLLLGILGGILGGTLAAYFLAKSLTGCYIYYGGGLSDKLEGCSDYYNTDIEHQIQCRCGKSVDTPVPITSQICDSLDQSECTSPYCLGMCSKTTYTPIPLPCEFPVGKNLNSRGLQCTTSATGDNYVFYGYKQVTILSLLSNIANAIANAPTYAEDFMKQILTYFLYGIGAMFLFGILLLFLKFAFSKLTESKSEVQSVQTPTQVTASISPTTPSQSEVLH